MKVKFLSVLFALSLIVASCTSSKSKDSVDTAAFERDMAALIDSMNLVGVNVAVVKDNQIVYTHAFGTKDLETGEALTDSALFRIASVSKSFTVTALMKLQEEGKIDITADVSDYLPFTLRNPRYPDVPITIEKMMSHTSSINDSQGYYTTFDVIRPDVKGDSVALCYNDYAPGQGYEYCNFNTNLLACVIENVTGTRYDHYIIDHILKPLGIYGGYSVDELDTSRFTPLYSWQDSVYVLQPEAYMRPDVLDDYKLCVSTPRLSAAGGMKITAEGLAKYMMMHMNYGKSPLADTRIISEESSRRMQTVISDDAPEAPAERDHAGLGLMRSDEFVPGITLVGHTGNAYGLRSAMFFDPEEKYGLVMICNGTTSRDVIRNTLSLMHKYFIAD